jgi:hypothetical protein
MEDIYKEDSIKGNAGEVTKRSVEDPQPVRVGGENQPKTHGVGDVLKTENMDLSSEKVEQVNQAIGTLANKTQRDREQYGPKVKELGQKSLQFLDWLATVVVDPQNGKQKGYLLQTALDLVGLPTILSVGDFMGALRGYKNIRDGHVARGVIELVTAIMPGVPTGPVHKAIDIGFKIIKDDEIKKKILIALGITLFLVLIETVVVIFFKRAATTISLIIVAVWAISVIGTFMSKLGGNRTEQPTRNDMRNRRVGKIPEAEKQGLMDCCLTNHLEHISGVYDAMTIEYAFTGTHCTTCGHSYWTFVNKNKFGSDVAFKNSYVWVCSEAQLIAALKKQQPLLKKAVHKLTPSFEGDIPMLVLNVEKGISAVEISRRVGTELMPA